MVAGAGRWQAVGGLVSTGLRRRGRLPFVETTLRTETDAAAGACKQGRAPSEAAPGATAQRGRRRAGVAVASTVLRRCPPLLDCAAPEGRRSDGPGSRNGGQSSGFDSSRRRVVPACLAPLVRVVRGRTCTACTHVVGPRKSDALRTSHHNLPAVFVFLLHTSTT